MARNCRRERPPAKRRARHSAVPIPIMAASLAQTGWLRSPAARSRDEAVIGRDDLDASPQTRMALRVSHWGVNKTRFFRRDVMSHFTTFKATGLGAKLALAALAAAGVLGVATAGAATNSDVPSVVVKYDEQSLSTDRGVKDLYAKIVRAS